jgi:N6-adenosine-specific RNA methylase IME4
MTDDEMRAMPIPMLQDEGLLFLWVTGRAMEVGRECLRVWGYTRVDEVVWVKTNQVRYQAFYYYATATNVCLRSFNALSGQAELVTG